VVRPGRRANAPAAASCAARARRGPPQGYAVALGLGRVRARSIVPMLWILGGWPRPSLPAELWLPRPAIMLSPWSKPLTFSPRPVSRCPWWQQRRAN